jgi:hypothetical protein
MNFLNFTLPHRFLEESPGILVVLEEFWGIPVVLGEYMM